MLLYGLLTFRGMIRQESDRFPYRAPVAVRCEALARVVSQKILYWMHSGRVAVYMQALDGMGKDQINSIEFVLFFYSRV